MWMHKYAPPGGTRFLWEWVICGNENKTWVNILFLHKIQNTAAAKDVEKYSTICCDF